MKYIDNHRIAAKVFNGINAMLLVVICGLASCEPDEPRNDGAAPLAIEGWIEEGGYPVVIVTRAADLTADVADYDNYVEKWCRVSIFEGDRRVLLTGHVNSNYTPPFTYTTSQIKGEAGKTYRLLVETEDTVVESTSTIPRRARIDRLSVEPCIDNDTLYRIKAYLSDVDPNGHYKFMTRVGNGETRYYSSFLGTFEGSAYNPDKGIDVMKGIHDTCGGTFSPYYCKGDTVRIKLCSMEDAPYRFWRDYENAVSLSTNAFFNVSQGCEGNIVGARGVWGAYAISQYFIIIEPR